MNLMRDCIRMLAIPASALILSINILWISTGDIPLAEGSGALVTLIAASVTLAVFLVHAVIDFVENKGSNGKRWVGLFQDLAVSLSYVSLPVAGLFILVTGMEGWSVLGLLFICLLVSGALSFVGLAFAIASAVTGRYNSQPAALSAVMSASIFLSLALAIFAQPIAPVFLAISGAILLVAVTLGIVAMLTGPVLTRPGGISGVPAWETQSEATSSHPNDNVVG